MKYKVRKPNPICPIFKVFENIRDIKSDDDVLVLDICANNANKLYGSISSRILIVRDDII